jgi:anti-sigma factor RsiW
MNDHNFHPSDEELLLVADGELSRRRSVEIRAHLAVCCPCRARVAEIERTIGKVVRLTRESLDPELPPIDGARARLRVLLSDLVLRSHSNPLWRMRPGLNYRGLGYVFAFTFLLALGTIFLHQRTTNHTGLAQITSYAAALPNPTFTPGSTHAVSLANICSSEHDQVISRVSDAMRQQVFREYGIAGAPPGGYEIDYLVTPGLGGSDNLRNLWPEPHEGTIWNSYAKDQLEDHLHHLVCSGQVSLATAQHDIETDWISAYRKYFRTEDPRLPHS